MIFRSSVFRSPFQFSIFIQYFFSIRIRQRIDETHTHTHTLAVHASENTRKSSVHMSSQHTAGMAEKRPPRWKQPPAESQPASHTQRCTAHGSDTTTCSAGERGRPAAGRRPANARNMRNMVRNKKSTIQENKPDRRKRTRSTGRHAGAKNDQREKKK